LREIFDTIICAPQTVDESEWPAGDVPICGLDWARRPPDRTPVRTASDWVNTLQYSGLMDEPDYSAPDFIPDANDPSRPKFAAPVKDWDPATDGLFDPPEHFTFRRANEGGSR
jgi:hypothetical protein